MPTSQECGLRETCSHEPLFRWSKSSTGDSVSEMGSGTQSAQQQVDGICCVPITDSSSDSTNSRVLTSSNLDIANQDYDVKCGLFGFQPHWIQRFRTPEWVLFWLCWAGALQGFIVNGFVNVVITTIEKRYQMRSTESGLIAGGYDVASFLLLIPISYFGGSRSKPAFIGVGILVMAFGALVFSSPYFLAGKYEFSVEEEDLCSSSKNISCSLNNSIGFDSSLSNYKYLFFLGQFLHGAGAAPLYTLGCAYIDESVSTQMSSLYVGIYYTMAIFGPGLGYMLGGQFLQVYVDFLHVDPKDLGLKPSSNVWCGAWWIGFLVGASLGILIAIPISMFPKSLPGSKEIRAKKIPETHRKLQESEAMKQGFGTKLKDLPLSLRILISNPTFMFLNLAGASEGMLVSALATFLPKVIEQQFSLAASSSALIVGLTSIPGAGGGTFLGGYIVQKFNLKCAGIIKMCIVCSLISLMLCSAFIINCSNLKFAGKTTPYANDDILNDDFISDCNSNCLCTKFKYNPVCGFDNVMYYSPCHAGCQQSYSLDGIKVYTNCVCLQNATINGNFPWKNRTIQAKNVNQEFQIEAVREKCSSECNLLPYFLSVMFFCMFFTFLVSMPSLTGTLRCVAESQKSFALGIQWIAVRILGTIPAPFVFGSLIDLSCISWQKSCDDTTGACVLYDNQLMSQYLLIMGMSLKLASVAFFFLAWFLYKPPIEGGMTSTINTNLDKNNQIIPVNDTVN